MEKVNTNRVFAALKQGKISVGDTKIYPKGSRDFVIAQRQNYTQESQGVTTEVERRVLGDKWRQRCEDFVTQASVQEGDECYREKRFGDRWTEKVRGLCITAGIEVHTVIYVGDSYIQIAIPI
ncbi:MAG: hypothetical protein EON58_04170 [Alphaproteobacteria bacterium]|nr:MAG: hypothetical protein EON58_04170 [Alphaproteobacteria bacterium]